MNLSKTTQQLDSYSVLLIGDSCVDEYKIGTIDRLSPEAPVPVIKIVETKTVSGMASNVKKNFENLGIDVDFITNKEIIKKTRYIDKRSGQHMLRVDDEPEIVSWDGDAPFPIDGYDIIVISDYNKGFLSEFQIHQIIKNSECPVFIDTKKRDLSMFNHPDVFIKINELEYNNATSDHDNLIVTLGSKGAMYNGTIFPTKSAEVTDVCGCGDTFLAALVAQYLFTKDIEKAIIFANVAAGITVQHRGNYAPSYDEIRRAGY